MLSLLISLLLGVSYGQSKSFSQSCPEINGRKAQPGCVAVAMLHVMAHNSFPSLGTGTVAYTTPSYRLSISEDLSAFPFDWQKIRSLSTSDDTLTVSKALYACGVATKTDFCPENSTASFPNMISAFIKNFGYDPDMTVRSRECYDRKTWLSLLKEEIDDNRMVVMQANDRSYGSHAFVVDGYEILENDTLFHINWGWEGENNGYYDIDNLSPGIYSFSEENRIVINCKPDDGVKTIDNYLECHISFPKENFSTKERISGSVEVVNRSSRSFKGSYIVYLEDEDANWYKIAGKTYTGELATNHSFKESFSYSLPEKAGIYRVFLLASPYASYSSFEPLVWGNTHITLSEPSAIFTTLSDSLPDDTREYNPSGQPASSADRIIIRNGKKYFSDSK